MNWQTRHAEDARTRARINLLIDLETWREWMGSESYLVIGTNDARVLNAKGLIDLSANGKAARITEAGLRFLRSTREP